MVADRHPENPLELSASLFSAKEIILYGKVTNFDGYEIEVTCEGPWGRVVFDIPEQGDFPNIDETVVVKMR